MKIGSKSRKCCCVENSGYCFKVESCDGSTKCPDDVYLSEAALDWVLKQKNSPPYIILFNEYCCLEVTSSTDDISNRYNIADVSGVIIYSDTENQGGTPIQLYPRADDCEVCEQETGACCVVGGRGTSCFSNKTFDECMAYGADSKWIGAGTTCFPTNPCPTEDGCQNFKGVCRDESGQVSVCGDPETVSGCASTYSMTVSFPDAVLKSQSGFQCGCIGCDCDCCDNDGFCTTNGTLGGRSHTTTLTFDAVSGKWKSSEKVFGGYLNQIVPYATCNNCPDCNACECQPFDFGCPVCGAVKLLSWYYTVEVSQIMNQTNFPCGGGGVIPYDCCTPAPCAVWRVAITEFIKKTSCIDGIKSGCSECEDPDASLQTCESDSSTNTTCSVLGGGTHNWYIRQNGCGCPAGLTQSNAHWNPFDPATVPPTGAPPYEGLGGYRYFEHCTKCGCDNWMTIINPTHFTPASDYLDNIGFSIS